MTSQQHNQTLLDGPAMKPPTGVKPDFNHPANKQGYFILTFVLTVAVSTLAIIIRMYTKVRIIRKVGWEDYTSVLGYLLWISYLVPTSLIQKNGGGIHQWDVRLRQFISLLYYIYVSSVMYACAMFFIKLSILLQYMKIFVPAGTRNLMYWGIQIVIWLNLAFYSIGTLVEIFACTPREKFWDVTITTGHCIDRNAINVASSAVNSCSDFITLLLPQKAIWDLQMPLRRKLAISSVFLTRFFACVTSVLRFYYSVLMHSNGDVTWNVNSMGLWTYAELSMGIVCGCLPVSPRFFQTIWPRLSNSLRSGVWFPALGRWTAKQSEESGETQQWADNDTDNTKLRGGRVLLGKYTSRV